MGACAHLRRRLAIGEKATARWPRTEKALRLRAKTACAATVGSGKATN